MGWYEGTTTNTCQLIILYDDRGIVKDHRISQTASGSQKGVGEAKQSVNEFTIGIHPHAG
ncbi:MAG: hypothetical protein NTZ24_09185 [Deltaproteobacteria bacterium]|nr:hypothetical protein [Deltaproteobacteria bacterium]